MAGMFWLSFWLVLGVSLGLLNKIVFVDAKLPQATLTLVHLICTVFLSWLYIYVVHDFLPLFSDLNIKPLNPETRPKMWMYAALVVVNIVLGNGTVRYLSVPLAQVIRSLVPAFTSVIALLLIRETTPPNKAVVLGIVVVGAMCSVYGDVGNWSYFGLFIAFLGCLMASLKGTLQKKYVTGSGDDFSFHPIDLILKSSIFSVPICFMIALLTEGKEVMEVSEQLTLKNHVYIWLSGLLAGLLNISNVMATQATTAVAMAIAGNLRNALLIAFSIPIFSTPISTLNGIGIVVTLLGGAVYSHLSLKREPSKQFQLVDRPAPAARSLSNTFKDTVQSAAAATKKSKVGPTDEEDANARATLIAHEMFSSDDDDDDDTLQGGVGGKGGRMLVSTASGEDDGDHVGLQHNNSSHDVLKQ